MKPHLTKTENKIALWMERGKTPAAICAELAIAPSTLRVHQRNIRLKAVAPTRTPRAAIITAAQRAVLNLLVQKFSHEKIATHLDISPGTTMNHVTAACRALGITSRGVQRVRDIRMALNLETQKVMDDPIFS